MNTTRSRQLFTAVALVSLALSSTGRSQDSEPTECGTPKMHDCHCSAMVGDIQGRMAEHCRKEHGDTRENYIGCLRKIPEACGIVEDAFRYMTPEEQDRNVGNQCSTRCRKHSCRCNDGPVCGR